MRYDFVSLGKVGKSQGNLFHPGLAVITVPVWPGRAAQTGPGGWLNPLNNAFQIKTLGVTLMWAGLASNFFLVFFFTSLKKLSTHFINAYRNGNHRAGNAVVRFFAETWHQSAWQSCVLFLLWRRSWGWRIFPISKLNIWFGEMIVRELHSSGTHGYLLFCSNEWQIKF